MSSTMFYITLIVPVIVCVFGRNIQRQIDNFEKRYDDDYVSMRENLRDLWQHINQLKTTCTSNSETSTTNPTTKHHPAQLKDAADKNSLPTYVSHIVKGLFDEKEFLRRNINDLTGSIAAANTTYSNTIKEKMKYVHDIDAKCERVADDVEKLHHNNDLLSEKLERMEQTMRAEIDRLQKVINEAVEEVMQNRVLNNPGCRNGDSRSYKGTWSRTKYGLKCQRWDAQTPHSHSRNSPSQFPVDDSVYDAHNYCRDPDYEGTPWCYTIDPDVRFEHCVIPIC